MELANRVGDPQELPDVAVEEPLEVGAALPLDCDQSSDVGAGQLVCEVVEQPLGTGRAGRSRHRGKVLAQLADAERQRPGVVGVHQQEVEHAREAYVPAIATAMGDGALGDREHGVVDLAVDVDAAANRRGRSQQMAQLEAALDGLGQR